MKKILILALLTASAIAQTPVTPLPNPRVQFRDKTTDVPLAGGKVCTFQSGTTTPLTTYSEATGTSANTNPITLDADGAASIWVTSSAIKLVVYSSTGADGNCPNAGGSEYTIDGIAPARPLAPISLTAIADPAAALGNFWLSSTNAGRIKWSDASAIHTILGADTTDTETNKTLTSPTISNPTITGTDSGAETLVNKTLTSPVATNATLSTGVAANGSGFKHSRAATCTTGAGANATCSFTLTWGTAFADNAYTASCTVDSGGAIVLFTGSRLAASMLITVTNGAAGGAANGFVNCIAVHD